MLMRTAGQATLLPFNVTAVSAILHLSCMISSAVRRKKGGAVAVRRRVLATFGVLVNFRNGASMRAAPREIRRHDHYTYSRLSSNRSSA